jgi:hypothetical protein
VIGAVVVTPLRDIQVEVSAYSHPKSITHNSLPGPTGRRVCV